MSYEDQSLAMRLQLGTQCIDIGSPHAPYRFLAGGISGLEAPDVTAVMRDKAHLDGGVCLSSRVPPRTITLQFEVADITQTERLRAALISFFSPTADGVLSVTRNGVTRYIACRLASGVTFTQETLYHPLCVRVPLICPDPYFFGELQCATMRESAAGLLYFPFTLTDEGGITGGIVGGDRSISVDNKGDGEAGFSLVLSVDDGDGYEGDGCEMSGITLSQKGHGGDRIYADVTLKKGDTLEICTVPGAKYVRKNGAPCMLFSRDSRFFSLARGITTLDFAFDTLCGKPQASLSFRPSYLGV